MEWIQTLSVWKYISNLFTFDSSNQLDIKPTKTVFDMETGDPDDILSLYLLLGHPKVNLVAVTVHPGSPEQIGLIREILSEMRGPNCSIPVGYHNINHKKQCVSKWYTKNGFAVTPSHDAVPAGPLLLDIVSNDTVVITGGPLTNLASAIDLAAQQGKIFAPQKIVVQGGFAGCNIVTPEDTLKKFAGQESQPTYNLNGNLKAAKTVLGLATTPKYFVSKNVCHKITYTSKLAEKCKQSKAKHIQRLVDLLESYQGREKKLHDPFAVCCAIDSDIVKWKSVKLSCTKESKGYEWRSDPAEDTNTWITLAGGERGIVAMEIGDGKITGALQLKRSPSFLSMVDFLVELDDARVLVLAIAATVGILVFIIVVLSILCVLVGVLILFMTAIIPFVLINDFNNFVKVLAYELDYLNEDEISDLEISSSTRSEPGSTNTSDTVVERDDRVDNTFYLDDEF